MPWLVEVKETSMRVIRGASIGVFLLLACASTPVLAQQATIVGTVTDESKAVLPGVTITATEVLKGTQVVVVSDTRGEYRLLQLTPGVYKVQADLQGFAGTIIEKIQLLVGQNVTAPILMKVATVAETVTVTGEAPLVDTTSTQVAGNVNPTQMQEVPLLGRNWLELSKMVPGMTANVVSATSPGVTANNWAMNLDGQQVANKTSQGLGQPKLSRDAIAEYQIVTNLYDITQGRSEGVQLQAISKSGTNQTSGSLYGFFRSDAFNSADAVSHTVLPYKDEQYGGTIGGPIIQDKMHYFFSIEPERTPGTIFDTVQALGQTFNIPDTPTSTAMLLRVDTQISNNSRLSLRGTYSKFQDPNNLAPGSHPSQASDVTQGSINALATWSQVLSSSAVQEFKAGWNQYTFSYVPPIAGLLPEYDFPGLTLGDVNWQPQWHSQNYVSARYNLTVHRGAHDLKVGGEYLNARMWDDYWVLGRGQMTFTTLPANIGSLVPQATPLDPSTWNLTGLNSIAQRFNINYPKTNFTWVTPDPEFAFWIGDNWRVKDNVTINYGVRYDNFWDEASVPGVTTNSVPIAQFQSSAAPTTNIPGMTPGDFGYKSGVHDNLDIGPQAGVAWNVGGSNDFVIRGGSGLYYTVLEKQFTKNQVLTSNLYSAQFNNNGSNPNFVANPTGGITTYAQAITTGLPQSGSMVSGNLRSPMTWQSSIGFSKQLGTNTGITADLIQRETYREQETVSPNLFYNPATGYNFNPSTGVPNPSWGQISSVVDTARGNYSALQTSVSRRVSRRIQGGASYTLMFEYHDEASRANNPFNYLDGEYATSTMFQRNTLRGWASYELPWDFAVSASYSYGSGNRYADSISSNPYGATVVNRLNLAAGGGTASAIVVPAAILSRWEGPAVIASGVVIPRDALEGTPYNRLDLRLTKSVRITPKLRAQLIAEVFNAFNYANYTGFNTTLSATSASTTSRFGQPTSADVPREGQFAFRFMF
jgi:Carboxypeptidase regulatory-like domain